ncbi:peritrophin-55 [Cochliomyia hominivorax]
MKSVFICAFMLATLVQHSLAYECCNLNIPYTSTMIGSCTVYDYGVKWPNYIDPTRYTECVSPGNLREKQCPDGLYFAYVYQKCVDCNTMIPPPACEYLEKNLDVQCIPITTEAPTTTTTATTTTSEPTTKTTSKPTSKPTLKPTISSTTIQTTPAPGTGYPEPPTQPDQPPSSSVTPSPQNPSKPQFIPPTVVTPKPGLPTPPTKPPEPEKVPDVPPTPPKK